MQKKIIVHDIETIKTAIIDRETEAYDDFDTQHIINRGVESNKLKVIIGKDIATIITGIRRCGKSTLALQLCKLDNFGYVNFEDERLKLDSSELNKVMEALYSIKGSDLNTIVFDEIQNINGWESFVSRLIGSKRIIITGSNARLMSKELGTALTGRHVDFELFPFSFSEFLNFVGEKFDDNSVYLTKNKPILMKKLNDYITMGGFPLGIKNGGTYLLELYNDIVIRDILQRHKIRHSEEAKMVIRYVSSNLSEISYSKIARIFNIKSPYVVGKWISYAEDSYLILKIDRYSKKLKERLISPKKIYPIDTGIAIALLEENRNQMGRLMETIVAIELNRRKSYYGKSTIEINYWKDYQHREVDFLIRTGDNIIELLQVSHTVEMDEKSREFKSILKASDELKCNNLSIITWDQSGEIIITNKKIVLKPLYIWLLDKQS